MTEEFKMVLDTGIDAYEIPCVDADGVERLLRLAAWQPAFGKTTDELDRDGLIPRPLRGVQPTLWSLVELRDWFLSGAPARDEWESPQDGNENVDN